MVQNHGMNLHDLNKPRTPAFTERDPANLWGRPLLERPLAWWDQLLGFEPRRPGDHWREILDELTQAWMELERNRVRPDRFDRVGIRISVREWRVLQMEAPLDVLRNAGLPFGEGQAMRFRGYPLLLTR